MEKIKTVQFDTPYTFENSNNPWLMDNKNDDNVIEINGNKITAMYMWSMTASEREALLQDVYNYYRQNGFPYELYNDNTLIKEFKKLIKLKSDSVITPEGYISNYGQCCLNVCRHFCADKFWKASNEKMLSIEDVFYNDELFIRVLKNRMGWNVSTEGGEIRPYMFGISDAMIRTGIRNSGNGYGVSNFRPIIAKYFYEKYGKGPGTTIYDFSGGWGARALAALSLNYNYVGVDPLTSNNINNLIQFYTNYNLTTSQAICYNKCSQDNSLYDILPNVDLVFSCPPYFNLEVYSKDNRQSYNEYSNYNEWLEKYWRPTVKIGYNKLNNDGYFIYIIKDNYGKLNLKDGMDKIIIEEGFELVDTYQYKTSTNHLSGKIKSGRVSKNNEYVLVYKKFYE